jgi:hypothetical protein
MTYRGRLLEVSGVHLNVSSKYALKSIGSCDYVRHHGLQIMDQLFKSNLIFCVFCVFTLQTDKWGIHNRLFNASFEDKFK